MLRASFVVVMKPLPGAPSGVTASWTANHLSVSRRQTDAGAISVLNFVSSGELISVKAAEVDRIEFDPAGACWCSECDASIEPMIGAHIHGHRHHAA